MSKKVTDTDLAASAIRGQVFDRAVSMTLRASEGAGDSKHYQASLSSDLPVERYFGTEILSHETEAVNMDRAARGLSLLFNHDIDEPIGRVSDIRIENRRLVGALRFSPNATRGPSIQADVDAGFLGDVSIRYSIDEFVTTTDKNGHDTMTITRWTPMEVSIVTVPADHTVGVGRNHQGVDKVTIKTSATGGEESDGGNVNVVAFGAARDAALREGVERGAEIERQRIADIYKVFSLTRYQGPAYISLRDTCIEKKSTPDQARVALLNLIDQEPGNDGLPTATRTVSDNEGQRATRPSFVAAGEDAGEKFAAGAVRAILLKADALPKAEAEAERGTNEYARLSLTDMAREWCNVHRIDVRGRSARDVVRIALSEGRRTVGLGTVDFPGILANVANKSLLMGWEEAATTWRQWCRVGSTPDFKRANRTGLSGADLLDKVPENMEYKRGDMTDRTEYMTAYKFGKLFAITREAILNDDLQALSATPRKMGRAADLTVNKEVIDLLCSAAGVGPTLNQDSLALFHSTHANYTATSGTPAVSTLEVGRNAMARQTDPNNGMPLNIQPKYLFVPSALVTTAKILVASEKDPLGTASATGGATTPNPFYNQLTVIGDPYLDDTGHTNGTVAWYLFGDQNMNDTFEVAFVDGQSSPYLESRDGWSVDGVEYKVRIEFGVAALDFRAMYRKKGA